MMNNSKYVIVPSERFGTCGVPIVRARKEKRNKLTIYDIDWELELKKFSDWYKRDTQWNHLVMLQDDKNRVVLTYITEDRGNTTTSLSELVAATIDSYKLGLRNPMGTPNTDTWIQQLKDGLFRYTPERIVSEFVDRLKQSKLYDGLFNRNYVNRLTPVVRSFCSAAFHYDEETARLFVNLLKEQYSLI